MIENLQDLFLADKFTDNVWLDRGLNPSAKSLCASLQNELNLTIKAILKLQQESMASDKAVVLKKSLLNFDKYELDTEEKELIADYFAQISELAKTEINKFIDEWLYGKNISSLPKHNIEMKRSISSECTNCKESLNIDVITTRNNVAAFWEIVQCNKCNEFNLLTVPANVDKFRNGNFFVFEILKQTEHSIDQVKDKMRFYREANSN
jgi:hypothetical protein